MVKTTFEWPEDEGDDMEPNPGETPEEFFARSGYMATEGTGNAAGMNKREGGSYRSEQHQQEVSEFMAVQDQMIMEAAGFGKELVAYFKQLVSAGLPFEAVIVLTREWQQAEIQRRTNLDALEMRLNHE